MPQYHDEIHREAYDTSTIAGYDGDAAFLAIELDQVLYPGDHISPFVTSLSHDPTSYHATFVHDFTPADAEVSESMQERLVLEVAHSRIIKKLGWLSAASHVSETYNVKVRNVFLQESGVADEIVTNYVIDGIGSMNVFYTAAVRRSDFAEAKQPDFEPMTFYDVEQVFSVINALYKALQNRQVFGN